MHVLREQINQMRHFLKPPVERMCTNVCLICFAFLLRFNLDHSTVCCAHTKTRLRRMICRRSQANILMNGLYICVVCAFSAGAAAVIASPIDQQHQQRQHLLGARECTWGPSYWCYNIT